MPIFISYSQRDRKFVDLLAAQLVRLKHSIWLDKWELNIGDSLIDKVQEALKGSSAILAILSKNSIESAWCKKELNAGLMREIESRNSILLPCLIDDCEIPLFLKEKLYADFRSDPDRALREVDQALAKISNPMQGHSETPEFHIDWSTSWGNVEGNDKEQVIELTFVEHADKWPYVIMSQCVMLCNDIASRNFVEAQARDQRDSYIRDTVAALLDSVTEEGLTFVIDSPNPKRLRKLLIRERGQRYRVEFSCRRMGADNGMDTLYRMHSNLIKALKHMDEVTFRPH